MPISRAISDISAPAAFAARAVSSRRPAASPYAVQSSSAPASDGPAKCSAAASPNPLRSSHSRAERPSMASYPFLSPAQSVQVSRTHLARPFPVRMTAVPRPVPPEPFPVTGSRSDHRPVMRS